MIDYDSYEPEIEKRYSRRHGANAPAKRRVRRDALAEAIPPRDASGNEFNPTYRSAHPDHYERLWVVETLGGFFADSLIEDVVRAVKRGKEANVYCCKADPATGLDLLAAKIYRPRAYRTLKNDAVYRQGRQVLDDEGKGAHDKRRQRADRDKTRFGRQARMISWIEHEYQTMQTLYAAGVDMPRPYAQRGNAILMEYVGEELEPAPTLNQVALGQREAQALLARLLRNVEQMLAHHLVHADLSAYNVLYWNGDIKIIDWPQAVDPRVNGQAEALLTRDVERICGYLGRYGAHADAAAIAAGLWSRYMTGR